MSSRAFWAGKEGEDLVLKKESEGGKTQWEGLAGPTAMLIRIFGKRDREPYGDIVHYHLKKPVPYQGAAQLVLRIDAISRSLNLPPSETTFRSVARPGDENRNVLPEEYWQEETFSPGPGSARDKETVSVEPPARGKSTADGSGSSGADGTGTSPPHQVRETIYLQLIGRQHTSIQGRIWGIATRKKYITFRSALELIYLLSEAV